MTDRENYLSIARRKGFTHIPAEFEMCADLAARYRAYVAEHPIEPHADHVIIPGLPANRAPDRVFLETYYAGKTFRPDTFIDEWGVAWEPGSPAAFHMRYMHHPMEDFDSVEEIREYPFPDFDENDYIAVKAQADAAHAAGKAAMVYLRTTIWETAWYMRGMENLMCDMMTDSEMAAELLDRVTERSVIRARAYARAGADAIFLGDDVGMQQTIMMSRELYAEWLKPRLAAVIAAARAEKPDILMFYHSCGHVTELIPDLIEAGIDVLDPVQPETNDFEAIVSEYSGSIAFHGSIGTQSVMPFGTPEEVRKTVFRNLDIAGKKGGLFVCPTHMLEPEVPLENVFAYIRACEDYTK